MARDDYLEHLASVPLFSQCSKAQLREIARVADELTVKAGTVLARQGDVGRELFVIVNGTASVTRDGQPVATIGQGGFVGELAVIAHVPEKRDRNCRVRPRPAGVDAQRPEPVAR